MKTLYRLTFLFLAIVSLYACNASHKTEAETVKRLLSSNDSLQQIYLSQIPYDSVAIFSKTFLSTLDTIRRYSIFPEDKMQRFTVSKFTNYNEFLEKAVLKNNQLKMALDYSKRQLSNLLFDINENNMPTDFAIKYIADEKKALLQTKNELTDFLEEYRECKKNLIVLYPKVNAIIDSVKQTK
jgi:hypothetical protein